MMFRRAMRSSVFWSSRERATASSLFFSFRAFLHFRRSATNRLRHASFPARFRAPERIAFLAAAVFAIPHGR